MAFVLLLLIACAAAAAWFVPEARWRLQLIALKATGDIQGLDWRPMIKMMVSGDVYLQPLVEKRNPYSNIVNPYASAEHVTNGGRMFRERCAFCHGTDGDGGSGPDIRTGALRHGDSDWALFSTISKGLPGTSMVAADLPDRQVWELVGFIDSIRRGASSEPSSGTQSATLSRPVSYSDLAASIDAKENWLTYSGSYNGQRFSGLNRLNRSNVGTLSMRWIHQVVGAERLVETTPLVVDGVMFLTEPPNDVVALDAQTGREIWRYTHALSNRLLLCCGLVNRGLAVLGTTLYMGTLDAQLVALNGQTGQMKWRVRVAESEKGYSMTGAPLAVRDLILVGIAGGENGIRGFVDAYDAETGDRRWRFYTVPGPGEPGHETWSGNSWQSGGAPTWQTGTYDPELDLIYWGVGNPGPVYNGDERTGDNLYSNSVVALDRATGRLAWHFQFTPHDTHDWDATQIPVLVDRAGDEPRRLMLWPNRNAFYYVLDRQTGRFLRATQFAAQTWASGIDSKGRPIRLRDAEPTRQGRVISPVSHGATNWWSPSYSRQTDLIYVPTVDGRGLFFKSPGTYTPGRFFLGGGATDMFGPFKTAVRALKAQTGELAWDHVFERGDDSRLGGVMSTAGDLVFAGRDQYFVVLDAWTGKKLWEFNAGGSIQAAPITFEANGEQLVTIAAGRSILTFGLSSQTQILTRTRLGSY